MIDEFAATQIDQEDQSLNSPEVPVIEDLPDVNLLNHIAGHKVLQLKSNFIPRGLIPLEQIFDINDVPVKPTVKPEPANTRQYNLGTEDNPQYINLSSLLPKEQIQNYLDLFQEYKDAFAWSYEELKTYDTNIIQLRFHLRKGQSLLHKS